MVCNGSRYEWIQQAIPSHIDPLGPTSKAYQLLPHAQTTFNLLASVMSRTQSNIFVRKSFTPILKDSMAVLAVVPANVLSLSEYGIHAGVGICWRENP